MKRLTVALGVTALLAGCQAQNPYSMFGPNRVPTPGMQAPAPYYPATAGSTTAPAAQPTSRPSISVASPAPSAPAATISDAGDQEPIRIVENPGPAARTATSPAPRSDATTLAPSSAIPATPAPPTSG